MARRVAVGGVPGGMIGCVSARIAIAAVCVLLAHGAAGARPVVDSDFSKAEFAGDGWTVAGGWDVFTYPKEAAKNPGPVARFPANQPGDGALTRSFAEVSDPDLLVLSLDYGWGWGDAKQGADSVSFMLLDGTGDGYVFVVHRTKATWAVQWGKVSKGARAKETTWAPAEIDASHAAVRDGGGLSRLTVVREAGGTWTIGSRDWNGGAGGAVRFADATTKVFSRLVLVGTKNFDDQVFGRVVLAVSPSDDATAVPASAFLDSVGVVSTFPDRGQPLAKTVEMLRFTRHPVGARAGSKGSARRADDAPDVPRSPHGDGRAVQLGARERGQ